RAMVSVSDREGSRYIAPILAHAALQASETAPTRTMPDEPPLPVADELWPPSTRSLRRIAPSVVTGLVHFASLRSPPWTRAASCTRPLRFTSLRSVVLRFEG